MLYICISKNGNIAKQFNRKCNMKNQVYEISFETRYDEFLTVKVVANNRVKAISIINCNYFVKQILTVE